MIHRRLKDREGGEGGPGGGSHWCFIVVFFFFASLHSQFSLGCSTSLTCSYLGIDHIRALGKVTEDRHAVVFDAFTVVSFNEYQN